MANNIRLFERDNSVSIKYREHQNEHIDKHWHRFVEMEFLISGSGTHKINGKSYPIRRGELHIMKLTDIHEFFFEENCWLYLVQIPTSYLPKDINSVILNCPEDMIAYFDEYDFDKIERLFCALAEEFKKDDPYKDQIIKNIIMTICLLLFRKLNISPDIACRKSDSRINDIIIFLQNNFHEPLSVEKIAEKFYMNSEYFSRYFKSRMGISPKEYLSEIRMGYAKKLICQSEHKIIDICMECGYNSVMTFLRDFKKKYNCTPKQMQAKSTKSE